jgi:hypothetical protein
LGPVRIERISFRCKPCNDSSYLLDHRLGVDGFLTRQALRFVCLAGGRHSFAEGEQQLQEMLGWKISDESIRQACEREAATMGSWMETTPHVSQSFAEAEGEQEFQTDATKVNTTEGWKDMKIGIFARRLLGASATAAQWESRKLPKPTARVAFAAIEDIGDFTTRCRQWTTRLNISTQTLVSVLGDGAEWIWNLAASLFVTLLQLLDIYHAKEHLVEAGKRLFGDKSPDAKAWSDRVLLALLADGWIGLCEQLGQTMKADDPPERRAVFDELLAYFAKHTERLAYAHRLHAGRPIGSGMVEGAAAHMIGKRLKQTGARWRKTNVNRMASLCCLTYSDAWETYWSLAA